MRLRFFLAALGLGIVVLPACQASRPADSEQVEALTSQVAAQSETIAGLQRDLEEARARLNSESERVAELEGQLAETRARFFVHDDLFYDAEHLARVKNNLDQEPWRTAAQELKSMADGYLSFLPEPIQGPWYVPSPNEDPVAQDEAVRPLEESTDALLSLAQYYLLSGEPKYAYRATRIADAWTGSLPELQSPQALYEAGWEMLVMAVAADMLRDYDDWDAAGRRAFADWLNERTWHIIARDDAVNNHQYWLAAQAAAVGVYTDDPGLFEWALAVYRKAIAYDLLPDGHLPQETARDELGMFYQNFALEALVLVAEMARQQGVDLWGYTREGKDIKLAIDYLLSFFDRPEEWPWSPSPQDITFMEPALGGKKTAWFEIAYYRYRDPEFAEYLLEQRPVFSRRAGGMTTLTHGLPLE